jgi:anti-sigma factor RsiW
MTCDEARQLLDAYIDGELELTRQLDVETHLANCVSCKDAAESIANQKLIVRMNIPVYKAPPALKSKIRATLRKEATSPFERLLLYRRPLAYAAAFIVLCCALAWTWVTFTSSKDKELIAEAISNHARSLMVSHLVDCVSSDQHTVRPWFNGKLDFSPPVADLTQAGYTLVGGRIDILEKQPVAAIVYQRGKHIINLFVWPATNRKIDLDVQSERGYHFCGWNQAGMDYFCIAEISPADLETFEDEVRELSSL